MLEIVIFGVLQHPKCLHKSKITVKNNDVLCSTTTPCQACCSKQKILVNYVNNFAISEVFRRFRTYRIKIIL